MIETTCCITGCRVIPRDRQAYVTEALKREILDAVDAGYTRFLTGLAKGSEQCAAEIIVKLKQQGFPLSLELVLPYAKQQEASGKAKQLASICDGLRVLCPQYSPNCFILHACCMISESSRLIAVHDGQERSSTMFALRSAASQEKDIRILSI